MVAAQLSQSARAPKLTIGMAVYDDVEGLWATIQALRLYHDLRECELIVVDNNPGSEHGKETKTFVESWASAWTRGAKYISMPENTGTTQPRNRIFQEASGDAVLVMDSHVLLAPGSVRRLIQWYDDNPESGDLLSGPMLYDDLRNYSTHFQDEWGSDAMWGTWGIDRRADRPEAVPFEPYPDAPEFEVFAMGLGLFSCRREKWLGFNPAFIGFGGEECYIHEKFRAAGRKCINLPFLRWNHRFIRVGGPKYPRLMYWKARNYVLGHLELGRSLGAVHAAFVASGKLGESDWNWLVSDPLRNVNPQGYRPAGEMAAVSVNIAGASCQSPPQGNSQPQPLFPAGQQPQFPAKSSNGLPLPPAELTLDGLFDWTKTVKRDWNEHLPKLRELASKCEYVTEFTKRRESTVALVAGLPRKVTSYQLERDELTKMLHYIVGRDKPQQLENFVSHESDALAVNEIEETDMLVIDSIHNADRLYAELSKHAGKVRKWLVIRGTEAFGEKAEGGDGPGLYHGLDRYFLEHTNENWHRVYHAANQYGVSVYSRLPDEPCIDRGPGTELTKMLRGLGVNPAAGCDCKAKARKMDEWGIEGCKANRDMIVGWMREGVGRWGWSDRLKAAAMAVTSGLAFKLDVLDPFPSLIDEAIRRAEEQEMVDKEIRNGMANSHRDNADSDGPEASGEDASRRNVDRQEVTEKPIGDKMQAFLDRVASAK